MQESQTSSICNQTRIARSMHGLWPPDIGLQEACRLGLQVPTLMIRLSQTMQRVLLLASTRNPPDSWLWPPDSDCKCQDSPNEQLPIVDGIHQLLETDLELKLPSTLRHTTLKQSLDLRLSHKGILDTLNKHASCILCRTVNDNIFTVGGLH